MGMATAMPSGMLRGGAEPMAGEQGGWVEETNQPHTHTTVENEHQQKKGTVSNRYGV